MHIRRVVSNINQLSFAPQRLVVVVEIVRLHWPKKIFFHFPNPHQSVAPPSFFHSRPHQTSLYNGHHLPFSLSNAFSNATDFSNIKDVEFYRVDMSNTISPFHELQKPFSLYKSKRQLIFDYHFRSVILQASLLNNTCITLAVLSFLPLPFLRTNVCCFASFAAFNFLRTLHQPK